MAGTNLTRWLANILLSVQLRKIRVVQGRRIAALARNPMRAQRALLARILAANRNTTFGRQHAFSGIRSYEAFAAAVPVSTFEQLRPYIDAEIGSGETALTSEAPLCYVRTSGTTGRPKDLPLTATHLKALRRIQEIAIAFQHRSCPEAFSGSMLAIASPPHEGVLENGKVFGSASGIVARNTPRVVRDKFIIPPVVLTIKDSRLKYLLILRLAVVRADLTYIATANATTLLMLIRLYRLHHAELIDDVDRGSFFLGAILPPEVAVALAARLRANPQRAAELRGLGTRQAEIRLGDLWPKLGLVGTWTFASAGISVHALRQELRPETRILDIGYIASEFRGTITLGRRSGTGMPTLDTHFFEFVERDKWDRNAPEFLTLDRLRKGVDYYVIITTPSGLYRYFINDLVRVTGHLHCAPLLRFGQKGKGVTNLTGEKLYESQVLTAVRTAFDEFGSTARFVMMLADEAQCAYRLYVENGDGARPDSHALAAVVDRKLGETNVEYQAKRESQRLGSVGVFWLRRDAGEAYKQYCVQQGQREGQFKTVALAYKKEFSFDLGSQVDIG
jgi:hypothetical protein